MREDTVRETIKKLLALGTGSNFEAEAQAALLKARELMAKYKISNVDNNDSSAVIYKTLEDISYGSKTDIWMIELLHTICEAHSCKAIGRRYTKFSCHPVICGFENDVEICEEFLRFTLSVIDYKYGNVKNLYKGRVTSKQLSDLRFSYGYGFSAGLKAQYDKQNEEGWGLVLTVPQEVTDSIKGTKTKNMSTRRTINSNMYEKGYNDGKSLTNREKLTTKAV